jgi:hypothetical protein
VFGGSDNGVPTDELFEWRGDVGDFVQIPRSSPWPGARADAAMAAFPSGELLLYGGVPHDASSWAFDAGLWRSNPALGPAVVRGADLVEVGGSAFLSGGATTLTEVADGWLGGTGRGLWTRWADLPLAVRSHCVVRSRDSVDLVFIGGSSGSTQNADSFASRGSTWHRLEGLAGLSPRVGGRGADFVDADETLVVGGSPNEDAWRSIGIQGRSSAVTLEVDASTLVDADVSMRSADLAIAVRGQGRDPHMSLCAGTGQGGATIAVWSPTDAIWRCAGTAAGLPIRARVSLHGNMSSDCVGPDRLMAIGVVAPGRASGVSKASVEVDVLEVEIGFGP